MTKTATSMSVPQITVRDGRSAEMLLPSPLRSVRGDADVRAGRTPSAGAGVPSAGLLAKSSGSERSSDASSEPGVAGVRRDGVEPGSGLERARAGPASELVRGTSVSCGPSENGGKLAPAGALAGEAGGSLCGGSDERGGDDMEPAPA